MPLDVTHIHPNARTVATTSTTTEYGRVNTMLRRFVLQADHNLYLLCARLDFEEFPATLEVEDQTYYRTKTTDTYALYKPALSGWGASPNPEDPRPVFDPRQR